MDSYMIYKSQDGLDTLYYRKYEDFDIVWTFDFN